MKNILSYSSRIIRFGLFICLVLAGISAKAQCWEDFTVYQVSPSGQLCSPQYVTLRAEYYNNYGTWVSGEFRWYTSQTDPYPVHTDYVYSDFGQMTSDYTLYADNGTTIWVSFYNYNTGCESYRAPYSFSISPTPSLYQDYASRCGYDAAKVQLSSNVSGVTYYLYKLYEYYDPSWGWTQDYQYLQSNSTGYFEIADFDPADRDKYYAKVYQPYGCSQPYYYQLWFELTDATPPTITGNLTVAAGSSTTLSASGNAASFNWYNATGTLVGQGWQYLTPTTLSPNTYTYQVRGTNSAGSCLSDPLSFTLTVSLPPVTYTALYNSSNFTKTIDLSKPVGTVGGASGTTATGGATYSLPIYTSPGTNGLQPSVAVTYNSQAGNGALGQGWNLAGLSVISRMGKTQFHNGMVDPVTYTSSDAFVLDGMRLNPISGNNGDNATIYATEVESFSKIVSITNVSPNNPDWFKVTTKDGTVMEFGNSLDSRVLTDDNQSVMLWRLNKISDVNGNYIEFKYDNGFRDSRIDEINYTGNTAAGLQPYNKLKFNYKERQDVTTNYEAGASMASKHLLTSIDVTNEGSSVKTYQFNYGFNGIASFLKEVVEVGSDGSSLNSTILLYGDKPQQALGVQSTVSINGAYDFFAGDFDADGKTDLLMASYYNKDWMKYHSGYEIKNNITSGTPTTLYTRTLSSSGNTAGDQLRNIFEEGKFNNFLTGDYNGDGRDDVVTANSEITTVSSTEKPLKVNSITVNYTTNTNYSTSTIPIPTGYQYNKKGNYLIPGDFDGDGNQDFILLLSSYPSFTSPNIWNYSYKAFLTTPSKGQSNMEILNFGMPIPGIRFSETNAGSVAGADKIIPADFDGDGKPEILAVKDQQANVLVIKPISAASGYSYQSIVRETITTLNKDCKIFVGDFNGDRKADLLVRNSNGTWKIMYSTGTTFVSVNFTFNQNPSLNGTDSDDKILIGDFNGDGKSDIIHGFAVWVNGVSNSSKFSVYYSKGGMTSSSFYYEQYSYANILSFRELVVGDFNGDGKSDLLNKTSVNAPAHFISFNAFSKENLLVKITDGHNTTTEFDYTCLTDKTSTPFFYERTVSLDDPANVNPINYVQLPLFALSSMKTANGIGGQNTVSFTYKDAVVHRGGRGFLGFKKMTTANQTLGTTTVSENEVNLQFATAYNTNQKTSLTSTAEDLSEVKISTTFTNLSSGFLDKRFFQKTDKVLNINYLNGSANEVINTYDNYGNITTSVSNVGSISGTTVSADETTTTTTAYASYNTPVPAKPDNIVVTKARSGQTSLSSTTQFSYDNLGRLATQVEYSGSPKAVTTTFSYNTFGNLLSSTISALGVSSRTSESTFDSKGRFGTTKKAAAGTSIEQVESSTYDAKWGKPLTLTSSDCKTISFEYDGFGRLKKTTYQNAGYSVTQSLNWDVLGETVYYSLTDYPGGKPDVKTWYDKLGRAVKTQTAGFNGQWMTQETVYDAKGNAVSQKSPYYSTETPVTTTTSYDTYNRVQTVSNPVATSSYTYTKLSGGNMQVTTTSAGLSKSQVTDATGKVVSAIDNGGQLDFTYDSYGNQVEVKHGTTILVSSTYDNYGRQTGLVDKNAGTISYQYNAFGQLALQTDNAGNTYNMTYDVLGRLLTRQGPEGTTTYEYYKNGTCSNNDLVKVTGFNGVIKQYTYNNLQRLQSEKVTIDGTDYTTQYGYNTYGNLTSTTYPSGVVVNNAYDASGDLLTVGSSSAGAPTSLFNATAMNGYGQYTTYTLGDGKTSQHSYSYGMPQQYLTTGIQDLRFSFEMDKGNLTSRYDAIKAITETFGYDNLNRLTSSSINGVQQQALTYDGTTSFSKGNIASKTDAGNYVYSDTKIHAVAYLTNPAGAQAPPSTIAQTQQQIGYTPFLKTSWIAENSYRLDFTYGPDYQRVKSVLQQNSATIDTRYYVGDYEKQVTPTGTREIHYVSGGSGLCAIIVRENGVNKFYSTYTDYLGSILTVTDDASGNVVAEQNFDAWGRNRNPQTWQYTGVPAVPAWLYRGYTGHEHLPQFGVINMNGRMYDPVQGRMLSPDNYVSTPFGTQGYNRYSYANNNPLNFTDPDGNFPVAAIAIPIIKAIVVGAGIGAASYTLNVAFSDGGFQNFSAIGFLRSAAIGGISGLTSYGIGSLFGSVGSIGQEIMRAYTHGFASGLTSTAFGGDFGSSFLSGAFGSLSGSAISSYIHNPAFNIAASSISGGIGAEIGGGDFLQGAASAGVIVGLNHLLHEPPSYKYNGKTYTSKSDLYLAILADQAMEQFGVADVFSLLGISAGSPLSTKRFVTTGSSRGTSFLSRELRNLKLGTFSEAKWAPTLKRLTATTTSKAGFIARWIPWVSAAVLTYDIGMTIYKTQTIYNQITSYGGK